MTDKDPNDFAPYEGYLDSLLWPSFNSRTGEISAVIVDRENMPPQYAAAALAKLVRWARIAPGGMIAMHPDEDSREYEVRSSVLGKALAARAVNLEVDTFFGMYGEFGVGEDADYKQVVAELAVSLGDHKLDWDMRKRIELAMGLADDLGKAFRIVDRFS